MRVISKPEVIWGSLLFRAAVPCQSLDNRLPCCRSSAKLTALDLQHDNTCMLLSAEVSSGRFRCQGQTRALHRLLLFTQGFNLSDVKG